MSDPASLLIGAGGLALGATSLTWQVSTYLLNGSRVKIGLQAGALADNGSGMITCPIRSFSQTELLRMARQGYSQPIIAIKVRNVGRQAVNVERWGIVCTEGATYTPIAESIGPSLPHRLEAGASELWAMSLDVAVRAAATTAEVLTGNAETVWLRGKVELGDGRTRTTAEVLPVAAGG